MEEITLNLTYCCCFFGFLQASSYSHSLDLFPHSPFLFFFSFFVFSLTFPSSPTGVTVAAAAAAAARPLRPNSSFSMVQPPTAMAATTFPPRPKEVMTGLFGSGGGGDLTSLCCVTELSAGASTHAILESPHRTLAKLHSTGSYSQVLLETYCMSLMEKALHVTVHPHCVGHCRQVKKAQEVLVVDEQQRVSVKRALVNSGCIFVPTS